jgi:fluoride exporter
VVCDTFSASGQYAARVTRPAPPEALTTGVVAAGGTLGSLARYGLALALPSAAPGFPTATFLTNLTGCLLIGAIAAVLAGPRPWHPLWRPFLVTGVLGGFTTFSTYCVETVRLIDAHAVGTAAGYLAGTLLAALAAAWAGGGLGRRAGGRGTAGADPAAVET